MAVWSGACGTHSEQSQSAVMTDETWVDANFGLTVEVRQSRRSVAVMRNFVGKTAFVTGGASGIGLGISKALLSEGMNVVVGDVNESHIADARSEMTARTSRSFMSM